MAAIEPNETQNTGFEQLREALENVEGVFNVEVTNGYAMWTHDISSHYFFRPDGLDPKSTAHACEWMRQRIAEKGLLVNICTGPSIVWASIYREVMSCADWDGSFQTEQEATLNAFLWTFKGGK